MQEYPLLHNAKTCRLMTSHATPLRTKVIRAINEAVIMGHYNVCLKLTLTNDLLNELISMGYDVSTDHDERTETLTHISWK